eukprot:11266673-Karenia_brevis.AAC.1
MAIQHKAADTLDSAGSAVYHTYVSQVGDARGSPPPVSNSFLYLPMCLRWALLMETAICGYMCFTT